MEKAYSASAAAVTASAVVSQNSDDAFFCATLTKSASANVVSPHKSTLVTAKVTEHAIRGFVACSITSRFTNGQKPCSSQGRVTRPLPELVPWFPRKSFRKTETVSSNHSFRCASAVTRNSEGRNNSRYVARWFNPAGMPTQVTTNCCVESSNPNQLNTGNAPRKYRAPKLPKAKANTTRHRVFVFCCSARRPICP